MKALYPRIVKPVFLLILLLVLRSVSFSQGRVVINEYMPWSGCNTGSEFIELLNFGPGPMNIGCYIVTNGQYSVTIPPNTVLQPGEYYVMAGQNVLAINCGNIDSSVNVDLNWATCNCTDKPIPSTGDGFMQNGGSANVKMVLLSPTMVVTDAITRSLPVTQSASITTSSNGGTCPVSTFDLDLMTVNYETINISTGIDNSYSRRVDGDCGWVKTTEISAGATNKTGSTSSATYSFSTLSASECNGSTGSISIGVSSANVAALFPMTYTLAYDQDSNNAFDNNDTYTFGIDSSAPSIDINNLAYGRYRITVGSSSGCNLQTYDFFIFNCYGVVLPFRVLSFRYEGVKENKRWFNARITGAEDLKSIILQAKEHDTYKTVNTFYPPSSSSNNIDIQLNGPVNSAEYYRVLLVSKLNIPYYSNELKIQGDRIEKILLWPNPAKHSISVKVPANSSGYHYSIINSFGKTIVTGKLRQNGNDKYIILTSGLTPGLYNLMIGSDSTTQQSIRFIKE